MYPHNLSLDHRLSIATDRQQRYLAERQADRLVAEAQRSRRGAGRSGPQLGSSSRVRRARARLGEVLITTGIAVAGPTKDRPAARRADRPA